MATVWEAQKEQTGESTKYLFSFEGLTNQDLRWGVGGQVWGGGCWADEALALGICGRAKYGNGTRKHSLSPARQPIRVLQTIAVSITR